MLYLKVMVNFPISQKASILCAACVYLASFPGPTRPWVRPVNEAIVYLAHEQFWLGYLLWGFIIQNEAMALPVEISLWLCLHKSFKTWNVSPWSNCVQEAPVLLLLPGQGVWGVSLSHLQTLLERWQLLCQQGAKVYEVWHHGLPLYHQHPLDPQNSSRHLREWCAIKLLPRLCLVCLERMHVTSREWYTRAMSWSLKYTLIMTLHLEIWML